MVLCGMSSSSYACTSLHWLLQKERSTALFVESLAAGDESTDEESADASRGEGRGQRRPQQSSARKRQPLRQQQKGKKVPPDLSCYKPVGERDAASQKDYEASVRRSAAASSSGSYASGNRFQRGGTVPPRQASSAWGVGGGRGESWSGGMGNRQVKVQAKCEMQNILNFLFSSTTDLTSRCRVKVSRSPRRRRTSCTPLGRQNLSRRSRRQELYPSLLYHSLKD